MPTAAQPEPTPAKPKRRWWQPAPLVVRRTYEIDDTAENVAQRLERQMERESKQGRFTLYSQIAALRSQGVGAAKVVGTLAGSRFRFRANAVARNVIHCEGAIETLGASSTVNLSIKSHWSIVLSEFGVFLGAWVVAILTVCSAKLSAMLRLVPLDTDPAERPGIAAYFVLFGFMVLIVFERLRRVHLDILCPFCDRVFRRSPDT